MEEEKRMIENYEVKHAIHLGGGEVVLAEDTAAAEPFLVCDCAWDNPFSVDVYTNIAVGTDYLDAMKEFVSRVNRRIAQIEQERAQRDISAVPLTAEDCISGSQHGDYTNQLIVIRPERLAPAARTADHQLLLATGGNGCSPDTLGTAVFCRNLFTGESMRWERYHVAGVIRPDRIPQWAKEKLADLQKNEKKPSLLGTLEAAKKTAAQEHSSSKKEAKRREPER